MDLNNRVVHLCLEGTRAEFEGKIDEARAFYLQAWQAAKDDYEACVAAHYLARRQERPEDALRWNQEALLRADAVGDDRVRSFYPSLYLNMGQSHESLGNQSEADRYYALAAELGVVHRGDI
jgi:tetratricopeptide (TPR) repeat protein